MTFDDFLAGHFGPLSGYARLLTGNRPDAEDLLADSLEAAQRRWHRIAGMDHPAAYVRSMISSRYLSGLRRWSRRHIEVRDPGTLPDPSVEYPYEPVRTRTVMEQHLQALPAKQRAAVVLHYFCDLPYEQVGRELGLSAGGARTLVFRALATLRVDHTLTPEDLT